MLLAVLLSVVLAAELAEAFKWQTLSKTDPRPEYNMVVFKSDDEGRSAVCRKNGWASGKSKGKTCNVPSGGTDHWLGRPFDVLVGQPVIEKLIWTYTTNADIIKKHGVEVKRPHSPEPYVYVCARQEWGPGKVVIWADNDVACYVGHGGKEHRFDEGFQVLVTESALKYAITNVKYNLNKLKVLDDRPLHMAFASLTNRDNREQLIHHTLTYSKTQSSSWENAFGFELGTSLTVSAGIPALADTEWEVSASESYEYTHGESAEETIEVSLEAEVTIPPKHRCVVKIIARMMKTAVPYQATIMTYFPNDTHKSKIRSGVYKGVSVSQDSVEIGECKPLEDLYY